MSSLRRLKVWIAMANKVITALARRDGATRSNAATSFIGFKIPHGSNELLAQLAGVYSFIFPRFLPKRFPLWSTHTILTG